MLIRHTGQHAKGAPPTLRLPLAIDAPFQSILSHQLNKIALVGSLKHCDERNRHHACKRIASCLQKNSFAHVNRPNQEMTMSLLQKTDVSASGDRGLVLTTVVTAFLLAGSASPTAADFRLCNNTSSRIAVGYKDADRHSGRPAGPEGQCRARLGRRTQAYCGRRRSIECSFARASLRLAHTRGRQGTLKRNEMSDLVH